MSITSLSNHYTRDRPSSTTHDPSNLPSNAAFSLAPLTSLHISWDISLHPRFAENCLVYFTYSYSSTSANRTRVARAILNNAGGALELQNWSVIFEVPHTKPSTQHFGPRMTWLADNTQQFIGAIAFPNGKEIYRQVG